MSSCNEYTGIRYKLRGNQLFQDFTEPKMYGKVFRVPANHPNCWGNNCFLFLYQIWIDLNRLCRWLCWSWFFEIACHQLYDQTSIFLRDTGTLSTSDFHIGRLLCRTILYIYINAFLLSQLSININYIQIHSKLEKNNF